MDILYTLKGKVLVFTFACLAFLYALIDSMHLIATQGNNQVSVAEPIPVIVLDDGENKKIMSVNEFFKTVSTNPNLSADDITKIVKLKNEIELGKAQVDLFKKLTEKKEEKKDASLFPTLKKIQGGIYTGAKNIGLRILDWVGTATVIAGVTAFVVWYSGYWPQGEYQGVVTRLSDASKNYMYTDPTSGAVVDYSGQLCADHGWIFNTFLSPSDCPR